MKNPRTQAWLTRPEGLATRLRTSRGGRSVRALADALDWAPSKVSRIETGKQVPTEDELQQWGSATGVGEMELEQWREQLDEVLSMRSTFQRRAQGSLAQVQGSFAEVESVSVYLRMFEMTSVPTMLQTPDYARELFLMVRDFYGKGKDVDEAVAARMKRQDNLYDSSKRFEFVFSEACLYNVPGRIEVMPAQMDRIIVAMSLPNARIGIIPFLKPLTWMPGPSGFVVYDADDAYTEGWTEDRQFVGPDVAILHRGMDRLWQNAVEGEEARSLIIRAQDRLLGALS